MPLLPNEIEKSNITEVEMPPRSTGAADATLNIFYKDGTMVTFGYEKIRRFLSQCAEKKDDPDFMISKELEDRLKERYSKMLESKISETISQDEIEKLFGEIHEMFIQHYLNAKKANKHLVILLGENHYDSKCLLLEFMVLQIALQFGIDKVGLEAPGDMLKFMDRSRPEITSINQLVLFNALQQLKISATSLEPEGITFDEVIFTEAQKNEATKEKDQLMAYEILDPLLETSQKKKLMLCAVGSDHLGMTTELEKTASELNVPLYVASFDLVALASRLKGNFTSLDNGEVLSAVTKAFEKFKRNAAKTMNPNPDGLQASSFLKSNATDEKAHSSDDLSMNAGVKKK